MLTPSDSVSETMKVREEGFLGKMGEWEDPGPTSSNTHSSVKDPENDPNTGRRDSPRLNVEKGTGRAETP